METESSNNYGKSTLLKWIGLIVLVIVLIAAAFVGGQLLNRQANPSLAGQGNLITFDEKGGAVPSDAGESIELSVIPAEELPKTQPDVGGIFVRREDNSVFLGTGKITTAMQAGEKVEPSASYDGPVLEAVVTKDTQVFRDATEPPSNPGESGSIEQKVEPGSLDEIGENSMVTVWGRKVGDRIIAEVLLYSEAVIMNAPSP